MPVTSSIERITPKLAAQLLKTNVRNRNVKPTHVARIARDMIRGRFQLNGSTIIVDEHGNVIDGQHRLLAVIESGVTIWAVVVRGVATESAETIDCGVKRYAHDVLQMHGRRNVSTMAAAIKMAASYPTIVQRGARAMTNGEVLEIAEVFQAQIDDAVSRSMAMKFPTKWTTPTVIAAAMIVAGDEIDTVDRFVDRVRRAENLRDGSPELAFLRWSQKTASQSLVTPSGVHWSALVRALNAYQDGRDMRRIHASEEPPLLFGIAESPFAMVIA